VDEWRKGRMAGTRTDDPSIAAALPGPKCRLGCDDALVAREHTGCLKKRLSPAPLATLEKDATVVA
jgi:hypothetical protein